MTISIRQVGCGFAGEVAGVDCRKPLSSENVAAIRAGMNDYAVLVFRDQKLSDEEQLEFTQATPDELRAIDEALAEQIIAAAIEQHAQGDPAALARATLAALDVVDLVHRVLMPNPTNQRNSRS